MFCNPAPAPLSLISIKEKRPRLPPRPPLSPEQIAPSGKTQSFIFANISQPAIDFFSRRSSVMASRRIARTIFSTFFRSILTFPPFIKNFASTNLTICSMIAPLDYSTALRENFSLSLAQQFARRAIPTAVDVGEIPPPQPSNHCTRSPNCASPSKRGVRDALFENTYLRNFEARTVVHSRNPLVLRLCYVAFRVASRRIASTAVITGRKKLFGDSISVKTNPSSRRMRPPQILEIPSARSRGILRA